MIHFNSLIISSILFLVQKLSVWLNLKVSFIEDALQAQNVPVQSKHGPVALWKQKRPKIWRFNSMSLRFNSETARQGLHKSNFIFFPKTSKLFFIIVKKGRRTALQHYLADVCYDG